MDPDIIQLAKMMRARRDAGEEPYTLLLGSSLSLTPAVCHAVCDSEDWEAFWETVSRTSPVERRALMHKPLSQLDLQAGYNALAQLVGAGYFNVVLTLNVDDTLDNALKTLPAREYRVWVHGEVSSREIVTALDRPMPRIKVVKLRGDVNTYNLPLTPEATFVFPDDLEEALTHRLRHDTIVVGDLLPFDDDVQRCIREGDGALWVIAAEGSDFLRRAKRTRQVGEVIAATEFNTFFTALTEALGLGEAEQATPEVAFIPPEERDNPYRGLEPFEPEHAQYFFGRELLTEMLVERLRRERFLAVLGASGSGKSSVVRAGVLPALAQGKLPGSENWPILVIKPGQNPQEALAGTLAAVSAARNAGAVDYARQQETRQEIQERLLHQESTLHELAMEVVTKSADDRRVVVVIDQFEELFTLCPFEQRQRFIDALLYAVGQPEGRTTVLSTMRADFIAQCTAYPDLSDLISSHQVWVRAMNDEGLRAAIERPAWLAGMRFEPGLVPLILADVGREPGALPLLEDALWSLFEHCREGDEVIEVRGYREIGGVQGALAKRADDVYATLSAREQEYTRQILLRLVEVREGQEPTQRRATLDELITAPEERAPVEKVVQRLTDARLLTTTQEKETGRRVVDISHEALIRGWPRLREWIDEDREGLRTHRRLTDVAVEWERHGRDDSYLYRGARLAEAEEWAEAHASDPNELEQAFLEASLFEQEREAREREEQRRKEKQLATLSLLLDVSQALWSSLDLTESIPLVLKVALEATNAQVARIVLLWASGDLPTVIARGEPREGLEALDRVFATAVIRDLEHPLIVENLAQAKTLAKLETLSSPIKAVIALPSLSKDRAQAVMWVGYSDVRQFDASEIDLLSKLANQVAIAIENARLYKDSEDKAAQLDTLLKIAQSTTSQLDLEVVLQVIVDSAVTKLGADVATLYLYDPTRDEFPSPVTAGQIYHPEEMIPPTKDSVVYRMLKQEGLYLAHDAQHDELMARGFTQREKIKSSAGFSLRVGGEPVGAMFVNYRKPHQFTEGEKNIFILFAQSAAIAIQNAQLYQTVSEGLETASAVAWAGTTASLWAHEVQQNTFTICIDVATLRSRISDRGVQEILDRIETTANALAGVIPSLPSRDVEEAVDLARVVEDVLEKREKELQEQSVKLQSNLEALPLVWANHQWLVEAFDGLTKNALRAMPGGGNLAFTGRVMGNKVLIDVIDSGQGFPDQLRNQLYKGRVVGPGRGGVGIGLLLVKTILNRYGGDIGLPYSDERGNVFPIQLLLAK